MKDLLARIPRRRRRSGAVRTDGSTTPVAGVDPATTASPSFRDRGRLRRRLRYLRRVRELGFRDLGGLVFDQHKFHRPNEELVRAKVAALAAVDSELRALEEALGDRRDITELREPGLSACPRCGTLHGSDANFCPSCGLALRGARTIAADVGEGVHRTRPEPPGGPRSPEPATNHIGVREGETAQRPGLGAGASDGADQPTAVIRPGPDQRDS